MGGTKQMNWCKLGFHKWHILEEKWFEKKHHYDIHGQPDGYVLFDLRIKKICKNCYLVIDEITERDKELGKLQAEHNRLKTIAFG